MGLQATPKPNTLLFGMWPAAMTELKGVFHWQKANLEWKTGAAGYRLQYDSSGSRSVSSSRMENRRVTGYSVTGKLMRRDCVI